MLGVLYSNLNAAKDLNMKDILAEFANILKAVGEQPMLELTKNWWIKLCIGIAILALTILPHLPEIIRAIRGQ